jgi:hypothetical protein
MEIVMEKSTGTKSAWAELEQFVWNLSLEPNR